MPTKKTNSRKTKKAAPKKKASTRKAKRAPRKGPSIKQAWADLFKQNEKAAKKNKMTDDQLRAEMQRMFPEHAEKTTITRVPRGIYNKGTNMFKSDGPSGTADRPVAHKYDEAGEIVTRAAPGSKPKKAPAKKKVAAKKKAPAKRKRVAKKSKPAATPEE